MCIYACEETCAYHTITSKYYWSSHHHECINTYIHVYIHRFSSSRKMSVCICVYHIYTYHVYIHIHIHIQIRMYVFFSKTFYFIHKHVSARIYTQVLITQEDFANRERYSYLSDTLQRLSELGVVPIINGLSKQPCIFSTEPYYLSKEPYLPSKSLIVSPKEP